MSVKKIPFLFLFAGALLFFSLQNVSSSKLENEVQGSIIEQLKNQHYAVVDFDLAQGEVQASIEAFTEFLALPEALKQQINHRVYKKHRRGWMGYQRRSKVSGDGDTKVFFHYHPALESKVSADIGKNEVVRSFLEKANIIWGKAHDKVEEVLKVMDAKYPGTYDSVFNTGEHEIHITLRFLKYKNQKVMEKIARSHFDVGTCTLAIAESHPGLRIGSCESDLTPITHQFKKAAFFLSSNFEAMVGTKSGLLPGWHDVVQVNENQDRWAIVVFVDIPNTPGISREETHKNPGETLRKAPRF